MEIKGKVHEVSATQQITDKLTKRELVLDYIENPQYPEYIKLEAVQDRCNLLDSIRVGDDVEVFFNLKGRPWTDKSGKKTYFNSLQLWKVNILGKAEGTAYAAPHVTQPDDDELPF